MPQILVVDDNRDLCTLMALGLRLSGHVVTQAASGMDALRAAKSSPPDLILLDIMMPDITGYEVATELHADPATDRIPIMFVSAKGDPEERVTGLAMPQVVDYVSKPFAVPELVLRVANALKRNS